LPATGFEFQHETSTLCSDLEIQMPDLNRRWFIAPRVGEVSTASSRLFRNQVSKAPVL
jgi:hypothetical protein